MICRGILHLFRLLCLSLFCEFLYLMVMSQFQRIAFLHLKVRCVFHPHINTKRPFSRPLQCRSVNTIRSSVVLPCYVVDTFRVLPTTHERLHLLWRSFSNVVDRLATGSYCCINEQQTIICQLVRHLLPESIGDHHFFISRSNT